MSNETSNKTFLLATGNRGKQREFTQVMAPLGWQLRGLHEFDLPEVEETGLSFVENALLKARAASAGTNLPALADDSGLVVPFLNGEPGIYSARYAGKHGDSEGNMQRLLERLADAEGEQRAAYFYCALAWVDHAEDPTPKLALGQWNGHILKARQGDGGFGYDPIFQPLGETRSAAELLPEEKNRLSHRGLAIAELLPQLA